MSMTVLKKWSLGYGIVFLFAISPILAMLFGYLFALLAGCDTSQINEARAPDCPGGEFIGSLFIAGWLMLFTLPLGGLLLATLLAFHLGWYLWRRYKTRSREMPPSALKTLK